MEFPHSHYLGPNMWERAGYRLLHWWRLAFGPRIAADPPPF
jgi:hypothetical protein